ncbi:hypothetical protein [Paraliomyxa miuraensis]|uniref:hypothetical protein n=1 Tax=Paraliomyxa miuraensis TaxID=376150 RepID=UPI00224CCF34|nr:hypothetical protein [Paraliomyxa miuraensis]MCX4239560.1 hypothetical protein [Paraliomyxa miuraensis]
MTHLRRYLEEHGVLYPEQLAEAVRRQQIYGGSLDTVVLELELLDPKTLGELLERACGFPIVPPDLLENGLTRPWTEIPEDMQRSRWVEPLAIEGNEVLVAVHPDLPDDLLGRLLRNVRRLRPMVTPECCLEKVAAERHGSVVPQRYAVLCAAYISAVRRRPSTSGAFGVPGHQPAAEAAPSPSPSPSPSPGPASQGPASPTREATPDDDDERPGPVAGSIDVVETAPMSLPGPAVPLAPKPVEPSKPAQAPPHVTRVMHQEADILRRLEQARAHLSASRSRDEALEAIVDAAMVLSPRVGLFRVRGNELVGLSTPRSHLPDLGGKLVAASDGSAAGIAMSLGRFSGLAPEADLRLAAGVSATTPCVLQRVQVRDRPVVFVYLDHDGAPIERRDLAALGDLADLAGQVFEEIVKRRRQPGAAGPPDAAAPSPTSKPTPQTAPQPTPQPTSQPNPGLGQPPTSGWGPAPPMVRAAHGDATAEPSPAEPVTSRVSTPEREHPHQAPEPALVPPVEAPAPPESWRLTPELAARALQEQARVTTDEGAAPEPTPVPAPEPSPAPEPTPVPAPEPTPAPAPSPAPEITPPSPAPEITPPSPAPEVDPPAREPEVTPPAHEPEITPPPSEPEVDPSASAPEIVLPSAMRTAELPRLRREEITEVVQRPALEDEDLPQEEEDDLASRASQRPTVELPRLDPSKVPASITRETMEIYSPAAGHRESGSDPASSEDDESRPSSLSRLTMHSSPPPPPLPPPPMSAVGEGDVDDAPPSGGRRTRSPTIHGLPPPEIKTRSGEKRTGVPSGEPVLTGDEDDVNIISLAAPIMPATARGRIELEDEDWVAPGSQLASDSQQGLIDAVIDAVVAGEAGVDQLQEYGDAAMLRLMSQFPGPLEVLRRDLRSLPPPSAHGPLLRTVIAVGAAIVPHIIDLLEHPNPDVRFYAAFVFHELRDPRCMRPLAKLAFDTNGDVRIVSMRVLETYRRIEGFSDAAAVVREELDHESRSQQLHATRAAGTLRDIGAIPQLVELLASSDRFIQEAALESLCSITGQQHGLKPHRWRAWYDEQGQRHRVEWIIDSLRHRDLPVRRWAADELVRITGHRVPFSPMGDKRAREVAAKAWMDWWEARGREMFGA